MEATDVRNISFEQRQKMQTRVQGLNKKASVMPKPRPEAKKKRTKRDKSRPFEMSSKHPVQLPTATPSPSRRGSFKPFSQAVGRDPRFDNLSGHYNPEQFAENYSFLEDIRNREMKKLEKIARKTKNSVTREKVTAVLRSEADKKREVERVKKRNEERERRRNDVIERLEQGRPARFRTKTEDKLDELVQRFDDLKNKGKLQNYIKKKAKKKPRPDSF